MMQTRDDCDVQNMTFCEKCGGYVAPVDPMLLRTYKVSFPYLQGSVILGFFSWPWSPYKVPLPMLLRTYKVSFPSPRIRFPWFFFVAMEPIVTLACCVYNVVLFSQRQPSDSSRMG
ncbi:hypothetical protein KP509_03G046200 [Ceratopteris richardii]|uniref:Uncharacterized protein n=1 Tax=Ceratopteris richardii TaxID=49495 RepID=A0A8T2V2K3_CERRI|nr:hypothetical protein KP509_03G046200 [Ceratopteris richardii]